jgi:hypothetical protein
MIALMLRPYKDSVGALAQRLRQQLALAGQALGHHPISSFANASPSSIDKRKGLTPHAFANTIFLIARKLAKVTRSQI